MIWPRLPSAYRVRSRGHFVEGAARRGGLVQNTVDEESPGRYAGGRDSFQPGGFSLEGVAFAVI
jgi:hypothetical protein